MSDMYDGYKPLVDVAQEIGINSSTIKQWVNKGHVRAGWQGQDGYKVRIVCVEDINYYLLQIGRNIQVLL